MRILVVTPTYLPIVGGAELAIYEIYRRLAESHEVRILTPKLSRLELTRQGAEDPSLDDDLIPIRRFHDFVTTGKGAGKRLWQRWVPPLSLSYLPPLGRELISFRPHVVNLHYLFPTALAPQFCRARRVPTLLSLVGRTDVFGQENELFRWHRRVMDHFARRATRVTALTRYMLRGTSALTEPSIIPYGADIRRYAPGMDASGLRARLGIAPEAPVLFTVQRLTRVKRVDLLLRAFVDIQRVIRDARLVIGGLGPEEQNLKRLAGELRIADSCIFTGFIQESQMPEYMALCDLFLFSSEQETFGLVLAQAQAGGKPLVAFDTSCIGEVISHGQDGLLVPAGDTEVFAETVVRLLGDKQRLQNMGRNARIKAERCFDRDGIAARYETLLETTAQGTPIKKD